MMIKKINKSILIIFRNTRNNQPEGDPGADLEHAGAIRLGWPDALGFPRWSWWQWLGRDVECLGFLGESATPATLIQIHGC